MTADEWRDLLTQQLTAVFGAERAQADARAIADAADKLARLDRLELPSPFIIEPLEDGQR